MIKEISVSEARQKLPQILKEIRAKKNLSYLIKVRGEVAGEIHFPEKEEKSKIAKFDIKKYQKEMAKLCEGQDIPSDVSQQVDHYVYGVPKK